MKRRNDIFSNSITYPRCSSHIIKSFISVDTSTLKIYYKKEKKNVLNYFIKFFIFTFLIYILRYSNNLDSSKYWNYKNVESVSSFNSKRSLAECSEILKEKKEQSKTDSRDALKSTNKQILGDTCLQTGVKQNYYDDEMEEKIKIEDKIVIGQKNMEEKTNKFEMKNLKERVIEIHKSNPRVFPLISCLFLTLFSLFIHILFYIFLSLNISFGGLNIIYNISILFIPLSLILTSIILIKKEKKKVDERKL